MSVRAQLPQRIAALPKSPGVYLFKDARGEILYIGKAKSLRDRVRSYFRPGGDGRVQVPFIEERVHDFEVIVTRSDKEAFLLENNLIKKSKPRFNIRLKDDKSYLHLKIDRRHSFPGIFPVRRPRKDGSLYFGPYSSARAIRTTLRTLRSVFPLRDCTDHEFANRSRPCLKYQIKMCSAPCVDYISKEEYDRSLQGAIRVLQGDAGDLLELLTQEMDKASQGLEYERAAVLRDRIAFLRNSTETQAVEMDALVDRDVVGMDRRGARVELVVLLFRDGKLLSASPFSFETELPDDEALSMFLSQYYHPGRPVPAEVLLPGDAYGSETLEEMLRERRKAAVRIRVPRSGDARRSVEMACRNARLSAEASEEQQSLNERILEQVQQLVGLSVVPRVVECIDVSHSQGSETVASLVRFEAGEPVKSGYRRYRIRSVHGPDDYGAMREVVRRRFSKPDPRQSDPDLFLVDGGRGQVSSAQAVLDELGHPQHIAGIVKPPRRGRGLLLRPGEEERLFLPGISEPVVLANESEASYFLQRVRDEAHRFAIGYHRRLRSQASNRGVLHGVEGLGQSRARTLLRHFGGLRELKAASQEQLCRVPGIGPTLAQRVYDHLHRGAAPGG